MLRTAASRKGLLSGADQVFAMLSNVIVAIAVGRAGGATSLGQYSFAFAVYLMVLGVTRALVFEPYLTHAADSLGPREQGLAAAVTGGALLATVGAAGAAVWGLTSHRPELLVLAAFLPALLAQDALRYAFFRWSRPAGALVLDAIWTAASLAAVVIGLSRSAVLALAAWATGAVLGVVWGVARTRLRPATIRAAAAWWWKHARSLGSWLTLDSLTFHVSTQLTILVVTSVAGVALLGELRAVQIVLGPLALIITSLGMHLIPHFTQRDRRMTLREATQASLVACLLTALGLLVLVAARGLIGHILFAGRLDLRADLLLPLGLQQLAVAGAFGAGVYIRSLRQGRQIFQARLASGVASVPLVVVAAMHHNAAMLAWTLAAQATVFLLVAFEGSRALDRRGRSVPVQVQEGQL